MKETEASPLWWKTVVITLLVVVGIFFLGWDPGLSQHDVNISVMPYEKPHSYDHFHRVSYHRGMTIREAANAAIQMHGSYSLDESEMKATIERHLPWTWRGVCRRPLDALTHLMGQMGWKETPDSIQLWESQHGLGGDPHGSRVDDGHSRWNSEAQPNDLIRVERRDVPSQ